MGQQRHHYEQAFEAYLRARRAPLVSVNEGRRSLLPAAATPAVAAAAPTEPADLKSFDYILYGADVNLLVEIKGRRLACGGGGRGPGAVRGGDPLRARPPSAMQNWVTEADIAGLRRWEDLFGAGFCAAFVFLYWLEGQPSGALFEEIIEHRGRWYALRAIAVRDYERAMRVRSARWGTVHLPSATFDRLSGPLLRQPRALSVGGVGGRTGVAEAPGWRRRIPTDRIPAAGAA